MLNQIEIKDTTNKTDMLLEKYEIGKSIIKIKIWVILVIILIVLIVIVIFIIRKRKKI